MRPRVLPILLSAAFAALAVLAACVGEPGDDDQASSGAGDAPVVLANCGAEGTPRLTGEGIGALRIGEAVKQVTLACHVLGDTVGRGPEGSDERSLFVQLGDRPDTVRAVVVADSIWRLHLTSTGPRTADSLGVGSLVRDLRARPDARLLRGEGGLFVTMRDPCGLSFRLGQRDTGAEVSLARLADSVRVTEVLVIGCR